MKKIIALLFLVAVGFAWQNVSLDIRNNVTYDTDVAGTLTNFPVFACMDTTANFLPDASDWASVNASDNAVLPFVIESGTYPSASTCSWNRIDRTPAGADGSFFIYHKNNTAVGTSQNAMLAFSSYQFRASMNDNVTGMNNTANSSSRAGFVNRNNWTFGPGVFASASSTGFYTKEFYTDPQMRLVGKPNTQFAISFWIRFDAGSHPGRSRIIALAGLGNTRYPWRISEQSTGSVSLSAYDAIMRSCNGNNADMFDSPAAWNHIAIIRNLTAMALYVNGTQACSFAIGTMLDTSNLQDWCWGGNSSGGGCITSGFYGNVTLDEIRIYSYNLTTFPGNQALKRWVMAEYQQGKSKYSVGADQNRQPPVSGFAYEAPCRINTTVGSLPYLPVYCILDTATLIAGGHLKPDCTDIRAFDSADAVELPFELVNGTCNKTATWIWVGDPYASDNDTIWLHYGYPSAEDGQNASGVWGPAGYSGVWHEAEVSGTVKDSLANNDLSPYTTGSGGLDYQQSSPRGYGIHVIGTSSANQARLSHLPLSGLPMSNDDWTLTWWQNKTGVNGNDGSPVIRWGDYTFNNQVYISQRTFSPYFFRIGGWYYVPSSNLTWAPFSSWQFFAVTGTGGSSCDTYQNGVPVDSDLLPDIGNVGTASIDVGGNTYYDNDWNDVVTSEIRIRNGVSSADWIKAEYAQTSSMGPEELIDGERSMPAASTMYNALPVAQAYGSDAGSAKKAEKKKHAVGNKARPPGPLSVAISSQADAIGITCAGDNASYSLDVITDRGLIVANQAVANGTLFQLNVPNGAHTLSATCRNGTYQNSSSITFTTLETGRKNR